MAGRGEHMASANLIDAADRQRRALELRKAGLGYAKIAEEMGYRSHSGAYKAVMTALHKTIQEPADELRTMEIERLDRMQAALWPQVQQGHHGAIDRVLKIMQRRSDYLGLDAPKVQHIAGADGGPILLQQVVQELATDFDLNPDELAHEVEAYLAAMKR